MHAARCAREMRQWPDGIRVQRTHYAAISGRLRCLCQGWNLHSVQGRCNWDTLSPSLVIGSQTQTGAGNYNDLGFILFSSHVRERESGSTKFKQLVWARERAARGANILQFFWKYFTKIFVKLGRRRRLEKWNLRLRLLFTKPRRWKRFYWAGLKCEMVCEALTDDILSVLAAAGESGICSLNTGLEEMDFHCILTIHKHLVLIIISPPLLYCPRQFSLV